MMLLALLALAGAAESDAPAATERLSASYVVKVASPAEATDTLVAEAERLGGWFATLDDTSVGLRVPTAKAPELLAAVEAVGLVAHREEQTTDVRTQLAELDARIASRRELLDQYLALLDTADKGAVLQLEREITSAIAVLEGMEGQRRRLADTAAVARVRVDFTFRDRRRPGDATRSPFPWIRDLSIEGVTADLVRGRKGDDKRSGLPELTVDGFATYRYRKEQRAASPDGVVLRTRAVKHKPKAELAYWTEAVQTHLLEQGYVPLADEALPGARWLEWGVPVGEVDHTYVVVVKPSGSRLELVEVAGPSEAVMGRRQELLESVRAVLP